MKFRLLWGVTCLTLLLGCGGGMRGNPGHLSSLPPASLSEGDELLAEELSAKRLEELYAKGGIPGSDPSLQEALKQWEYQVKFDVPIQMNKKVRAYLVYFSTERKETIRRYLARSTQYLPMIKEIFQEYGLPEDLAYLAMVESGFNPKAYSSAGAAGMWQFIKGTGLRYGLVIQDGVDERLDPEKSTRAAAKYLLDLYKQFGSWYLAAASYNCGEMRVQRELNKSNHHNFWELSANLCLPNETRNYVPQMIAATIIAKNPGKFGFKQGPYQPPMVIDGVQLADSAKRDTQERLENPVMASTPVRPGKSSWTLEKKADQSQNRPIYQAAVVHQTNQNPKSPGTATRKATAQVACAKKGNTTVKARDGASTQPYVASLFGNLHAASAGKSKATHPTTAGKRAKKYTSRLAAHNQKPSPALFASKRAAEKTKTKVASKSSASSRQKDKSSKVIVVSQSR